MHLLQFYIILNLGNLDQDFYDINKNSLVTLWRNSQRIQNLSFFNILIILSVNYSINTNMGC